MTSRTRPARRGSAVAVERLAGRGVTLNYRVRVPSFDAQLRLIERGVGVAIMPEATAQRGARSMAIEVLPLSDAYLVRRLPICVQRLRALPAETQSLIEQLRHAYLAPAGGTDLRNGRLRPTIHP